MYRVYCDDILIHDQKSPDKDMHLISPNLKLQVNAAGSFEFTLPTTNPGYDEIERFSSTIAVEKDGDILWTGRVISESEDFWKQRKMTCEGALAFLNDTTQPKLGYNNITNTDLFRRFILKHNAKKAISSEQNRRFYIGVIDLTINTYDLSDDDEEPEGSSGEVHYQFETNGEKTWDAVQTTFIDRIGGYIYLTYLHSEDEKYVPTINYVMEPYRVSTQELRFGKNLLEYTRQWDMSNLATVIIPQGKKRIKVPVSN